MKRTISILAFALLTAPAPATAAGDALVEAAKSGDLAVVKRLIAGGANPNRPDPSQQGDESKDAVHWAAKTGHAEVLAYLLDHGGKLNGVDSVYRETPLVDAAQFVQLNCVKLLLNRGADVNIKGKYGGDALYAVVNNVNIERANPKEADVKEIIRLLLSHGANANLQLIPGSVSAGQTLLYMPAYSNQVKLTKFILDTAKIDPALKTKDGKTVFDAACEGQGDVEMFDLLTAHGFKQTHPPSVCIQNAVRNRKWRLAKQLVKTAPAPATVLGDACFWGGDADSFVLALLAKGADVNAPSSFGPTPLQVAAQANNLLLVDALLRKGAKLDVVTSNQSYGTALHQAARYGNPQIVEVLLKAGARTDIKNSSGETALVCAAKGPIDQRPSDGPGPDWSKKPDYIKCIAMLLAANQPGGFNKQVPNSWQKYVDEANKLLQSSAAGSRI